MANLADVSYTADGAVTTFVVTFSYIEIADVTVTLDGVATTAYTWSDASTIEMNTAPSNGVIVKISRDSDVTQRIVAFSDGAAFTAEDLNNSSNQSIYLQQETRDLISTINQDNAALIGRVTTNETDIASNDVDIAARVEGAASSTDNAVPKFDGVTGKIIQESGIIIDDADNITGVANLSTTGHVDIDNSGTDDSVTVNRGGSGDAIVITKSGTGRDIVVNTDEFIVDDGDVTVSGDVSVGGNIDVTGNIAVTGTVDGRDVATDGTKLDTMGSGADVAKVGTPVDNQIGVWTGDGTLEGDADLTYDAALGHMNLNGELKLEHTATGASEYGVEIVIDADGNPDVKSVDVVYDTGVLVAGTEESVIRLGVDRSSSTGGEVHGIEVIATEGSAEVVAVVAGIGVNPVEQYIGAFGDMDSALVNATDRLAEFISDASDITMFVADNDTVTIGDAAQFTQIEFLLSTFSSKDIKATFEYSTGVGTWTTFIPSDGTNGMQNNGIIRWSSSNVGGWAVGAGSEYLIRITRTVNGSITSPVESKVQISAKTEYYWDKDGLINTASLKLGADATVNSILDDDTMAADSATALATQQSIKAYSDSGVQSLTNKTFDDEITMQEIATPATPSAGYKSIYPKTDGKLYSLDDAGNEIEIGSGGGSGGINYITDSSVDAEVDVGDWVTYKDSAGLNPVDGTAGTALGVVFDRSADTSLRGSANFLYTKDAVNRQGEGASVAFTIDEADQAQKLTCSFDYDASEVGYLDDELRLSVYDVTNSVLIRVNGEDLKAGKGKHYFQFQTASDSTSYRLIIHQSDDTATAYTGIRFDNFQLGPREVAKGTIITDWEDFTPLFTNVTISDNGSRYRRVGSNIELMVDVSATADATNEVIFPLIQTLFTMDVSELSTRQTLGVGWTLDGSSYSTVHPIIDGNIVFKVEGEVSLSNTVPAASGGFDNTDRLVFTMSVPIQGWSSDAAMSEDLGGRDIVVEASGNDGESIAANSEDIPFKTSTIDTTTSWSNAGNTGSNEADAFTCPETGYYDVSGLLDYTTPTVFAIDVYIGGVKPTPRVRLTISNGSASDCTFAGSLYMEKGQVMTLRATSTITLGNTDAHRIFIAKRSSPQTILETETVAARYTSNTSTSIPHNTATTIPFEDIDYNTHGSSYDTSTGIYTVPVSGKYQINNTNSIIIGTTTANTMYDSYIDVEGTVVASDRFELDTSSAINVTRTMSNSVAVNLTKGQEVKVRIIQTASSPETLEGTSSRNTFSIARIK